MDFVEKKILKSIGSIWIQTFDRKEVGRMSQVLVRLEGKVHVSCDLNSQNVRFQDYKF